MDGKKQLLRKGLLIGVGVAAYAQERAQKLAKELIKQGHLNQAEGKKLVRTIYQETERSGRRLAQVAKKELERLLQAAENLEKKTKKKKR